MPKGRKLDLAAAASLVRPRDSLLCGFVAGQPVGFLEAIGARRPGGHRPLHGAPAAPVRSRAESWGASGEWLLRARRAHGTCGRPFLEAARDPERLAIAEVDAAHRRDPRAGRQPARWAVHECRPSCRPSRGDTRVTTPRHHVQYVVTEYAAPEGDASPRRRLVVREIAPNQQFTRSPFPPEHNGCPSPILT